MKMQLQLAGLALALTFNLQPSTVLAQGSLTPSGAPAASMKSLAQIEPRTPISSAPFTISTPGAYYLTTNLTTTASNAIVMLANGVTLDLGGFTISSAVASAANGGAAILLGGGLSDITIANGHIRGGVTNNSSGVYSGPGFGYGIYYSGTAPGNVLVSRVSVSACLYDGINLGNGDSTVVKGCAVRTVGFYGIMASIINDCVAVNCGSTAIFSDQASDCVGESNTGIGVYAGNIALNCSGTSSSSYGLFASQTAENCYGSGGNPSGLYVNYVAQNCSGISSGIGISAGMALNCYGTGGSDSGISASTAQNCCGQSSSHFGISSVLAQNCYGSSTTSYGLYAGYSAIGCTGISSSGTGIVTYNAAFCVGYCFGGMAINATMANGCMALSGTNHITYKYNMP
jgi:hypothetical protein